MNFQAAVNFLQSFPDMERGFRSAGGLSMSLSAMKSLLNRLGNPQSGRHTIHVTGSKGKGSVCAMVASILNRIEPPVGLYTSPHLHSLRERIVIGTEPVSEKDFARGVESMLPAIEQETMGGVQLSTFGLLTALFFQLVSVPARQVNWQVVEVGLGGLLDATNVFDTKDVAVITSISLEHTQLLGDTPAKIALSKSGIITPGCTTVLAPQKDPSVREVIAARCRDMRSELIVVPDTYQVEFLKHDLTGQSFAVHGPRGAREIQLAPLGHFQLANAAVALAVIDALQDRGLTVLDQDIVTGLSETVLPGRMEVVSQNPLVVVDGAHNGESTEMLFDALRHYLKLERCILVVGVNSDKNVENMFQSFQGRVKLLIATASQNPRAMPPEKILDTIGLKAESVCSTRSVKEALELAKSQAGEDDLICVSGSFYVVAEAREHMLGLKVPGRRSGSRQI